MIGGLNEHQLMMLYIYTNFYKYISNTDKVVEWIQMPYLKLQKA